jgi:hypothetical protein
MTLITPEQRERYLQSGGNICPFCNSLNIQGTGSGDSDSDWHSKEVECLDCKEMWVDIYKIVNVEGRDK